MNALSRREEDTLMKATKAHALRECDPLVKRKRNPVDLSLPQPWTWLNFCTWTQNLRNVQPEGRSLSPGRVSRNTGKFRIVFLDCT